MKNSDHIQSKEAENLSAGNAGPGDECSETATLLAKRELELAECRYRLKAMTSMYEDICSSRIWETTAPLRKILDKISKAARKTRIQAVAGNRLALAVARELDKSAVVEVNDCSPGRISGRLNNVPDSPGTMLEILYVYKIASFGGVERILLNRAEAFRRHAVPCRISLYFYEDEGALEQISAYIAGHELGSYLRIVTRIEAANYDYVIAIDTPEVLQAGIALEKIAFECHTTYHNSLRYLARLPDAVRLVAVPSAAALADIGERFPRLKNRLVVVRNFIPAADIPTLWEPDVWEKRPLLYLGRMDSHKNFTEVLDIFQHYRQFSGDDLFLLLVGPVVGEIDLSAELSRRNISEMTVVLPPVSFARAWQIYAMVRQHKGIFISASQAESFGLAAAEALSAGVPVMLSGIAPHMNLVAGSLDYVYPLGDVVAGAGKLRQLVENYDRAVTATETLGQQFSEENFLSDWQSFIALLHCSADKG